MVPSDAPCRLQRTGRRRARRRAIRNSTPAHGTLTPAAITAIRHYHGSDTIDLTITSTSLPGATRDYTSLNQIIDDVNLARIYTGFHYRSTLLRSNALGIAVANWVNDHMMTVLRARRGGPDDKEDTLENEN
jgi:hypothetical protein